MRGGGVTAMVATPPFRNLPLYGDWSARMRHPVPLAPQAFSFRLRLHSVTFVRWLASCHFNTARPSTSHLPKTSPHAFAFVDVLIAKSPLF